MSGRIIYIIGALTSIIVMAAYSAKLISFLTVQNIDLPVHSFEELLEMKYEVGVIPTSGQFKSFQTTNHPLLSKVFNELVLKSNNYDHLPKTFTEGLERVCKEDNYAMITSYKLTVGLWGNISCKITHVPSIALPLNYAMIIPKGFPFKDVINKRLMRLREVGILYRTRSKTWPHQSEDEPSMFFSVVLESVTPMLTVVVLGICGGVLILNIEILVNKFSYKMHFQIRNPPNTRSFFRHNIPRLVFYKDPTITIRRPRRNYVLYA